MGTDDETETGAGMEPPADAQPAPGPDPNEDAAMDVPQSTEVLE